MQSEIKVPTAKELFYKMLEENDECTSTEMMIEFAKLHVQTALESAFDKAIISKKGAFGIYWNRTDLILDKDSILNAYSMDLIK